MSGYQPHEGHIKVGESFRIDGYGYLHLQYVQVTARVRISLESAERLRRQYHPGVRVTATLDERGSAAEVEIPLRLTDEDLQPYLVWRDSILKKVYALANDGGVPK